MDLNRSQVLLTGSTSANRDNGIEEAAQYISEDLEIVLGPNSFSFLAPPRLGCGFLLLRLVQQRYQRYAGELQRGFELRRGTKNTIHNIAEKSNPCAECNPTQ